jgi:hypothetical protein
MFSFISKRAVFIVLLAAFLFMGCSDSSDDSFVDDHKLNPYLIGTWTDSSWSDTGDYDGYTIGSNNFSYIFGGTDYEFMGFAGNIVYVSNFYYNSGVIIIEYDPDHKASYYGPAPDYAPLPLKGDYIGIYYKNLVPGVLVEMGVANEPGGAEKTSLVEAINAFTLGNEGAYMTHYGTYIRQ